MFDDLLVGFAESFEFFAVSEEQGLHEISRHYNAMVALEGKDYTDEFVTTLVQQGEGWTQSDLRRINELAGKKLFNV